VGVYFFKDTYSVHPFASGLLIAFALVRRKQREWHFRKIDELRRLSFTVISSLAAGKPTIRQPCRR
jgi:hypothetical protein